MGHACAALNDTANMPKKTAAGKKRNGYELQEPAWASKAGQNDGIMGARAAAGLDKACRARTVSHHSQSLSPYCRRSPEGKWNSTIGDCFHGTSQAQGWLNLYLTSDLALE